MLCNEAGFDFFPETQGVEPISQPKAETPAVQFPDKLVVPVVQLNVAIEPGTHIGPVWGSFPSMHPSDAPFPVLQVAPKIAATSPASRLVGFSYLIFFIFLFFK
jgi:hypothetical protein